MDEENNRIDPANKTLPKGRKLKNGINKLNRKLERFKNKKLYLLIFFVILLIIILVTAISFINYFSDNIIFKDEESYSENLIEDEITPTITPVASDTFSNFPYLKDGEIYLNNEIVTDTNGEIVNFEFNETNNDYAYITKSNAKSNGLTRSTLTVYRFNDGKTTKLYEKSYDYNDNNTPEGPFAENPSYEIITDIGFSKDGEKLAAISNKNLIIFNSNNQTESSIPLDISESEHTNKDPRFSYDNSKLIFSTGYWEGKDSTYVDLKSKKITELPYSIYAVGKEFLDWLPENQFLVYSNETESDVNEDKNFIILASLSDLEGNKFDTNNYKFLKTLSSDKTSAYGLAWDNISDSFCIISFNLDNGDINKIKSISNEYDIDISSKIKYSEKLNMLFVEYDGNLYRVDLNVPNPNVILWTNNAQLK